MGLFRNDANEAFALTAQGAVATPIRSGPFKLWLRKLYFTDRRKGASSNSVSDAAATIEAMALFGGESREVQLRVARHKDDIWFEACR